MRVGDEWSCRSWIQATSAQGLTSASKNSIEDPVTGSPEQYAKGTPYVTNLGRAESMVSFKRGMARVIYEDGGIIPIGDVVRKDFTHRRYVTGSFSSGTTPSALPDLNPWAHVDIEITGRAHSGTQPQLNLAVASTPKCIRINEEINEEHPIPLGHHGAQCPGRPGEDYTSPSQEIINQQAVAPSPDSSTTPSTVTYTCGIHSGDPSSESSDHSTTISGYSGSFYECQSHQTFGCGHKDLNNNSSNHEWGTAPCGDDTHVGYLCQINSSDGSDHEWVYESCPSLHAHYECDGADHSLQASCSETNANGDSCTVTSFYACQSHTHQYPDPTPILQACGVHTALPSQSIYHRLITIKCGHTFHKCQQMKEKHYRTQCTHTDNRGRQCTYRYFICLNPDSVPSHNHRY